jgi:hypothetical protein
MAPASICLPGMFEVYDGQGDATDAMEEAAAALARTEAGRKPRGGRNWSASLQRGRTGTAFRQVAAV